MRCVKKQFDKEIICAGDLRDYIMIKKRELKSSSYDDFEPQEVFTTVMNMNGRLEKISPTARFDGVNIEDKPTHIVYIPYEPAVYELDRNSLFVETEGVNKNRQFKMLSCINEEDRYLYLYCKETGFDDKEASDG